MRTAYLLESVLHGENVLQRKVIPKSKSPVKRLWNLSRTRQRKAKFSVSQLLASFEIEIERTAKLKRPKIHVTCAWKLIGPGAE